MRTKVNFQPLYFTISAAIGVFITASCVLGSPFKYSEHEWSVVFPDKPKISNITSTGLAGDIREGKRAELPVGKSFLRAEILASSKEALSGTTAEMAKKGLLVFAEANGLRPVEMTESTINGRLAINYRGTKSIADGDKMIPIVASGFVVYGERSVLMTQAMAPADVYPTDETQKFLDSVQYWSSKSSPKASSPSSRFRKLDSSTDEASYYFDTETVKVTKSTKGKISFTIDCWILIQRSDGGEVLCRHFFHYPDNTYSNPPTALFTDAANGEFRKEFEVSRATQEAIVPDSNLERWYKEIVKHCKDKGLLKEGWLW